MTNSVNDSTTPTPLSVDVILPVYSGKRWVREAIASVVEQRYPHWHLFVVDDASPDDTLDYARAAFAEEERITWLRLERGRRAPGARMVAIDQGSGDAIAFLDQDDRWHPDKLGRQVARLQQEPLVHAVHTDVAHIDEQGRKLLHSADSENTFRAKQAWDGAERDCLLRHLFLRLSIRLVSSLVRRDAFVSVGGFDCNEALFGGEDWEFWVRFAAAGYSIAHLAEPLTERRLHQTNVTLTQGVERYHGLWVALDKVLQHYPETEQWLAPRQSNILHQEITYALRRGEAHRLRERIGRYIRLRPRHPAGYAFLALSMLGPLQRPLVRLALRLNHRR